MTIDVHSHLYFPRYMEMLRERKQLPRSVTEAGIERLIILPQEESGESVGGRPIDPDYWTVESKIGFMERSGIEATVLSLANPWVDFLEPGKASSWARQLNQDLEEMCRTFPGRLYGLGVLPLQDVSASVRELEGIAGFRWVKGAMIGSLGAGKGLDDASLNPVWRKAEELGLVLYVHPHYGIDTRHFGTQSYALNFALGFPFETSIAVARMIFSGVLQRFPKLKMVLAHAGGTLPYLAGRLDGCAKSYCPGLQESPSEQLRRLYYDATAFHGPTLKGLIAFAGISRIMFGTDHPFRKDPAAIYQSFEDLSSEDQHAIRNANARSLFGI